MERFRIDISSTIALGTMIIVLVIVGAMGIAPWVNAQEAEPSASPEIPVVVVDPVVTAPPVDPVPPVEPAPPVDPAPPGDPVTPESPAETDPPAAPVPTATETPVSDEPTAESTEEPAVAPRVTTVPSPTPSPTTVPTPSPTVVPSPTPEPTSAVTWRQTESVTCEPRNGQIPSLKYQQSSRYYCSATVSVSSDIAMPTDMKIAWTLDVSFPDSYRLELPVGSLAGVTNQLATSATSTQYILTQPWTQGSGAQTIAFEIVVTRNTCAVGEQALTAQAAPALSTESSVAAIRQEGAQPQAATSLANFLPNLEAPSVSMTPVDFGTLRWNGETWGTATATSTVTVTNSGPCATSQQHLVQLQSIASNPAMTPILTSVDTSLGTATQPELDAEGIALVPAGLSGSTTIEVRFQLAPIDGASIGDYSFGFDVSMIPAP